jgi:hypothetical protein
MKQKFKRLVIVFAAMFCVFSTYGEDFTRKFNKSWPAGEVETLEITNKYGQVKVEDTGGTQVTIDVVVTAEGPESLAKEVLDDVTIHFDKTGRIASAVTELASNFKSRGNFSIDYTVNIPADRNLKINNKYGNVILNKLDGGGEFNVSYGNFTAGELNKPGLILNVAYGKADVEKMQDATVSISYSKFFLGTGTALNLTTKYSTVNADKLTTLQLNSKYDGFNFGELTSFDGESKYSNYKIGQISKRLKLSTAYGAVKVDHIPAGFELLDITSGYAQVSLGIDENASYEVNASCSYCEISYPKEKFKGNRIQENTHQSIDGKISSGMPGKVVVVSKYGNIRLTR